MKAIYILILLAILIRLIGINQALFDDEPGYITTSFAGKYGISVYHNHPPLVVWLNMLFTGLFGIETCVLRLVPLLFSVLTLFLLYKTATYLYNKKAGLIAVALATFTYYPTQAALQVGDEGVLAFFFLSAIFSLLKYSESKSKRWLFLVIASTGLALLVKETAFMLFPVLFLYILISNHNGNFYSNLKASIKIFTMILLLSLIIFAIYPLISIYSKETGIIAIKSLKTISTFIDPNLSFVPFAILLFWLTPLFIGLTLLSFKEKITKLLSVARSPQLCEELRSKRGSIKDLVLVIWLVLSLIFYLFFVSRGDYTRYFVNILPPVILLSSKALAKIKFNKKEILISLIVLVFWLSFLFFVSFDNFRHVPRNTSNYLQELKAYKIDFVFPYTGSAGPLFVVPINVILYSLFFSGLFFIIYWFKRLKLFFLLFLSVSLAFNIFLLQEYLLHTTQVDPSEIILQMSDYYKTNKLPKPVYANNAALLFYIDPNYLTKKDFYSIGLYGERATKLEELLKDQGGVFLLLDYPIIPRDSLLWDLLNKCALVKKFKSDEITMGYIFNCSSKGL